ncbi:hypothetical protein Pla108_41250 [Botrimarina colliarenosi]|uniref:Uncharacterized protein n=1 Tax=Botrimarina colliarenosi TaxID=2528001 RepID=A0A5C5ZYS0_9BACT|nr:hypothetical protein [Botrimarina colliarenosi]TWT92326.1 hypothetical protein Pla108_41250 [Botrimarina colliarenosi]
MTTPLTRIRLWNRRWFLLVNLGLLLAIGLWWLLSRDAAVARLRAAGEPTCYADLVAEAIPSEANVAAGLRDLAPKLKQGEVAVADALDLLDKGPFKEKQVEQARQVLEQNAETLAAVRLAIERPRYASLLKIAQGADQELIDYGNHLRSAARLLSLEGRLAIVDGKTDKAVDAVAALARLGKLYESEPVVINRMKACAYQNYAIDLGKRLVESGHLPKADAGRLDAALAPLEDRSGLAECFRTERAYFLEKYKTLPFPGRMWLGQSSSLRLFEEAIAEASNQFAKPGPGGTFSTKSSLTGLASLSAQMIRSAWESENRTATEVQELRDKLAETAQ